MFSNNRLRPNKLQGRKDKNYHRDYAKFCLSTMDNYIYRKYVNKCLVNWSFFKGGDGQWVFDEDIESFFLDESGDVRNRLKWTKNVIKPMVQQYVGNAIRLQYNAEAQCISDFVINKREKQIAEAVSHAKNAQNHPMLKSMIQENHQVEDTPEETEQMFRNVFSEQYEKDINNLIKYVVEDVNMQELKVQITRNLAICGLGIYKGYECNEVYEAESVNPLFFGWDMSAVKPDLSDAEYMFEWYYMDSPSILERYQSLSKKERQAIENYSRNNSQNSVHKIVNNVYTIPGSKIPVYEVYWKDIEKKEYGWVVDEYGYPYYTMINDPNSEYTDSDLIKPPTDEHQERMGDKKKETIYVDVMRFCIMIPQEEIGNGSGDIILDYGILPYQEKNLYDPANVKFPYKCYTWVYDRGEILSPLDDTIDPQRFLNRTISVVESQMEQGRGITATILVQKGTLKVGGSFVAGVQHGRVRAMFDERNNKISEVGPSTPVLVLGFEGSPQAGDTFVIVDSEREAREIALKRQQLRREQENRQVKLMTLDEIANQISQGEVKELPIVVKGDVDGSVEALADSLMKLTNKEVAVNVIHKGVGAINEGDVLLAAASRAIIVGFHVRPHTNARKLAESEKVDIRLYNVIYDAINEVKSALEGMLSPVISEELVATVEIRDTFKVPKVGTVAGCYVQDGKITRNNKIRLFRDGIVIYEGSLATLKRFKDDVKEVDAGYECGLNINNFNDVKVGDIIEAYKLVETKKTLE